MSRPQAMEPPPAPVALPSRPLIHRPTVAFAAGCAMLVVAGLITVLTMSTGRKAVPVRDEATVLPPLPEADLLAASAVPILPEPPPAPLAKAEARPRVDPSSLAQTPVAVTKAPPKAAAVPPVVVKPMAEPAAPRVVKRRDFRTADEICRDLLTLPELGLDDVPNSSMKLLADARKKQSSLAHAMPQEMLKRPDLVGLPMRMGLDCRLGKESAENLQVLSRKLRKYLAEAVPRDGIDTRPDVTVLRRCLLEGADGARREWLQPEAVPVLVQLLGHEDRPVRRLLVELLAQNTDRSAAAGLVQRALFDPAADVREAAVVALHKRPADEYQAQLVEGLRYPWPPAGDHAAEALVALGDATVVPRLVDMLSEPDPKAPTVKVGASRLPVVREVVRVNHLRNCLLCHAPSFAAADPARGLVPAPGQPVPPSFTPQYYQGSNGTFVRADVTYLRQDFSVYQPVARPDAWPANQRYDYLVRARVLTPEELDDQAGLFDGAGQRKPGDYPQRQAVLFALRELTGQDAGPTAAEWHDVLRPPAVR